MAGQEPIRRKRRFPAASEGPLPAAEPWCCLFGEQRRGRDARGPSPEELVAVRTLYGALRERLASGAPPLEGAPDGPPGGGRGREGGAG